jgi:hypothetical protein
MLFVTGALAEFEVSSSGNARATGSPWPRSAARKRGEKTLTPERTAELVQLAGSGISRVVLARDYGISRETAYEYLRQAGTAGTSSPAEPALLP